MNLLRSVIAVLFAAAVLLFAYLLRAPAVPAEGALNAFASERASHSAGAAQVPFSGQILHSASAGAADAPFGAAVSARAFDSACAAKGLFSGDVLNRFSASAGAQVFDDPISASARIFPDLAAPAGASDSASFHFGFKKSQNGSLPSIAQEGFLEVLRRHGAIFLGDTAKKELYLTFDNGYENGYTAKILDILKEKQVPAAFFVTGHYVKDQPELVKRMAAEGHIVGNHSWSHPDLSRATPEEIRSEMERVREEVARLTGQSEMRYMRPPRGIFSGRMLATCKALGYTGVFWSVAYKDWETSRQMGAQHAYDRVMEQLHPGAVILLHAVSRDNAEALGRIIDSARAQGYTFKSLDELMVKTYR